LSLNFFLRFYCKKGEGFFNEEKEKNYQSKTKRLLKKLKAKRKKKKSNARA